MLEVKGINVYYGPLQVLFDVSLSVKEKEIVTVIGPNGAGKTTLLKTISGLLHPKSGSIRFLGEEISSLPAEVVVRKGIAHVPEGRGLFPYMTVLENLQLGAYTKEARSKMKETLEEVFELFPRLKERKDQLAYTLSGGEQQMLAIGRALMSRPKLLVLDEPSQGLAPKLVKSVMQTLEELNARGITILLVEQNVHHALNLADRGFVLENGRVVLEGAAQELLNNSHVKSAYLGI
jgi:branched-chain amino acid transport system ATP-binding protein